MNESIIRAILPFDIQEKRDIALVVEWLQYPEQPLIVKQLLLTIDLTNKTLLLSKGRDNLWEIPTRTPQSSTLLFNEPLFLYIEDRYSVYTCYVLSNSNTTVLKEEYSDCKWFTLQSLPFQSANLQLQRIVCKLVSFFPSLHTHQSACRCSQH